VLLQQQRQIESWAASAGVSLAEIVVVIPPYSVGPTWSAVSSSGSHNSRCRQTGEGPKEIYKDDQRAEEPVL